MNQKNLLEVDWTKIPAPTDDGAAAHLVGMTIPKLSLMATDDFFGHAVDAAGPHGRVRLSPHRRAGQDLTGR